MHYDLQGKVDRYGSKNELLVMSFVLTGVNILTLLLLTNIYKIDPKRYAAENKDRMVRLGVIISIFISAILCMFIYTTMHENIKFVSRFIMAGVGLLFSFIGNYMHSIKPNYFAGLRLPWTLENEENWRKTHLLAGKLWFAGGLVMAAAALLTPPVIGFIVVMAITLVIVIIPAIYSYRLYKEQKKNQ
jgi:uncharacterized membrane protein